MKVLIVDDDALARRALARVISQRSISVSRIDEALDAAEDMQPDAVLIDRFLDGEDGLSALPALRVVTPRSALIVFTGQANTADRRRALELGADAYVSKLHVARIRELVQEIVQESRQRRGPRLRSVG